MVVTTQQGRTLHQFVVLRSLDKGVGVMKILYKQENGRLAIIQPTSEALEIMTIDEIALKDVPMGLHFAIVEDSEIPTDRTFRDAWTVDDADLTDGIGGESNEFN